MSDIGKNLEHLHDAIVKELLTGLQDDSKKGQQEGEKEKPKKKRKAIPENILSFDKFGPEESVKINGAEYWAVPCTVSGDAVSGSKYSFTWIIPNDTRSFTDIVDGQKWFTPIVLRQKGGFKGTNAPSVPDNNKSATVLVSAYWHCAYNIYKDVIQRYRDKNKEHDKVQEDEAQSNNWEPMTSTELFKLEANLNALAAQPHMDLFVSDGNNDVKANSLKTAEEKRIIKIAYNGRTMGRIRRPDWTHKRKICPYEIHESKRIGLDLYLSAGAKFNESDGIIDTKTTDNDKSPFDFLSLAVGMVPYPGHSDGPRLMMGGKNLKQAEENIDFPEPAIVPGRVEINRDDNAREVKNLIVNAHDEHNNEISRFYKNLGVNALVALMPYRGFTYEDGLVVSESLAKKLSISKSTLTQSILCTPDKNGKEKNYQFNERIFEEICAFYKCPKEGIGKEYYIGDVLPAPSGIKEKLNAKLHYDNMQSGKLIGYAWSPVVSKKIAKNIIVEEFIVKYTFEAERLLHEGDKLTGRNGNKGVVTKILPDDKMPQIKMFGREVPADMLLTPASVMGRKNLGQIYEMAHSLLLKAKENNADIDGLEHVTGNDEITPEDMAHLVEQFDKIGADNKGAFPVRVPAYEGIDEITCRAFAGWQYVVRLHHHSRSKLQYRGAFGPVNTLLDEPQQGGGVSGQRLGEMENWSLLSYNLGKKSENNLIALRTQEKGNEKKEDLLFAMMKMIGFPCKREDDVVNRIGKDEFIESLGSKSKKYLPFFVTNNLNKVEDIFAWAKFDKKNMRKGSRDREEDAKRINRRLQAIYSEQTELRRMIYECKEGSETYYGFYINQTIRDLGSGKLESALRRLSQELEKEKEQDDNMPDVIGALAAYQKSIYELIGGKAGLLRSHIMGYRLNFSGRAVIVPKPDNPIDTVTLPTEMLVGMMLGRDNGDLENKITARIKEKTAEKMSLNSILLELRHCGNVGSEITDAINEVLKENALWVFMVRQPSLHRHSVQSFKVNCWLNDVIGFPPFATAGFNADFDGDTMAVFMPPRSIQDDMSRYSLPFNPGVVGTGELAMATGLDLALGWHGIKEKNPELFNKWAEFAHQENRDDISLEDVIEGIFRCSSTERIYAGELISELQRDVCRYSTGAETLTPLGFARAAKVFENKLGQKEQIRSLGAAEEGLKTLEQNVKGIFNGWAEDNCPCPELWHMVKWHVKGKEDNIREMVGYLGEQKAFAGDEKDHANIKFIAGNFWNGLDDDESFVYSYGSRDSMGSKKLAVAVAGYLSRQLAEGLYNTQIVEDDCKAAEDSGLEISLSEDRKNLLLRIVLSAEDKGPYASYPVNSDKDIIKALNRIAWGRMPSDKDALLSGEDLKRWAKDLAQGEKLILRSPITCKAEYCLCARCAGADVSQKVFDSPKEQEIGTCVGITAAQAIGERGTQLAMKRFHDVGGTPTGDKDKGSSDKVSSLTKILCNHKWVTEEQKTKNTKPKSREKLFADLIEDVLTESEDNKDSNKNSRKLFKELPQQLIHFEIALKAEKGLHDAAKDIKSDGKASLFSAMEYGWIKDAIEAAFVKDSENEQKNIAVDELKTLKCRIMFNRKEKDAEGSGSNGTDTDTRDKQ